MTVTGVDDNLIDGTQTTTLTVSVDDANSDDAFDPVADQTVGLSTTDDDGPGFTVAESGERTAVSETGTTDTLTVVLDAQPASDVVLTVTSGDTGEATVSPASLTFTSANWNSAQTVTVTGVDDTLVDRTQSAAVIVSVDDPNSDDAFDPLPDFTVKVFVSDDDGQGFTVVESGGSTSVSETGTTDTLTLALESQPNSDVVLTITSGDTGEATVDPASLTFTNANWDSAQTVTVTGVDDTLWVDGTQTTTLTVSVDDANSDDEFDAVADQTVSVSTTDDDGQGFTVAESGGGTSVSETGTTDTFTVVLNAQPATDVVLTVASGDTGEATVSPASLRFTNANWNNAQTVTVTGVDDTLIDGTQTTTVTVSVDDASSDDAYDPLPDQTVSVSTTDDDVPDVPDGPGFTVVESGGSTSVSETGTTDTLTVVLDAQPASDVVLTVTSGDTGEAMVSPASLTFTSANWNSAQTVTVTGVDDTLIDGIQTTILTVSVDDANSDDAFDPLADQTLSVFTTERAVTVDLSLAKTHTGAFSQGAEGVTYTLLVTNGGSGPSEGAVTVTDILPPTV